MRWIVLITLGLLLPMVTFAFDFKNIIFGGNNDDESNVPQDGIFGNPELKRQRRQPIPSFLEDCKGYICQSSIPIITKTNQEEEQQEDILCVEKPIDCPCSHPLEKKSYMGEWYTCVRTGL
ncbi:hypothetical protein BDC45DRAFT_573681 [Circinella umbellata]|nr:hypothetical protein BDC45DRAFT_573681 [Circinella umbellata]